ncbi:hypothetical protein TRFO_04389 [Tritrichomonas foetus]|uniref:Importin N-terminal domain-containing protein n=1 Tax=Tritrichomonas foetus TaxID=1144522 RepID=A0A1J4KJ55_9EUKA|nr:hypothetical protein TRFO_04389 [Tritrichomonas foetus]|eukprot:OHT09860.1 hypothetical protein TRFO_04389 [Tritrichomonas foetus]
MDGQMGYKITENNQSIFQRVHDREEDDNSDESQEKIQIAIESISKIVDNENIEESLNNLVLFTNDPDFDFIEGVPSQLVTNIIAYMRSFPQNRIFALFSARLIGNIWLADGKSYPLFVDPELIESVTSLCLQKVDEEIALTSIRALTCLINSTYEKGSPVFAVDQLDAILNESIMNQFLSFFDSNNGDLILAFLSLLEAISQTYQKELLQVVHHPKFFEILNVETFFESCLSFLCNLSKNEECFTIVFNSDFRQIFLSYLPKIKNPVTLNKFYSVLSLFVKKYGDDFIKPEFWSIVTHHLLEMATLDTTEIFAFIETVILIYPKCLNDELWTNIFSISEQFSFANKERCAVMLCIYFHDFQNSIVLNLESPPLSIAINGGYEFILNIAAQTKNPISLKTMLEFLTEYLIKSPETFLPIIHESDIIEQLKLMKEGKTPKKEIQDEDLGYIDDDSDLVTLIESFLTLVSFSFLSPFKDNFYESE